MAFWPLLAALSVLPTGWYDACRQVDWAKAWSISSEALASDSSSADAWASASVSGFMSGSLSAEDAADWAHTAISVDSTSSLAWAALGITRSGADAGVAAAAFERALVLDSLDVVAWSGFGTLLDGLGDYGPAAMDFRRALRADPLYGPAVLGASHARCALGDTIQALYSLNDYLELSPGVVPVLLEKGSLLDALGLPDSARAVYSAAAAADPTSIDALQGLGLSCESLGKYGEAIKAYRRIVDLDPGYSWAYGELGLAMESTSQPDSARAWYMRGLDVDPGYAWAALRLGLLAQGASNLEEARRWLSTATSLDPTLKEAWVNRGLVEEDSGDPEAAADMYRQALSLDSTDTWTWGELGYVLNSLGRSDEAAAAFETAIGIDSSYSWGWEQRGLLFEDENRPERAMAWYRKAWLTLDELGTGPSQWLLGELGMLLEQDGRTDSAEVCFALSVRMDSTYSFGTLRLGRLYDIEGRAAEAQPLLMRYAALANDSAVVFAELAGMWKAAGDSSLAGELRSRALELSPGAYVDLAWSFFHTGHTDRAEAAAAEARSTGLSAIEDWLSLADLYSTLGMPEESSSCYDEATREFPDDPSAWIAWGSALSAAEEYSRAEDKFRHALELDSLSVDGWNYLGESLLFQDRYGEATTALEKALRLDPSSVYAICYLGLVEERRGNPQGALDRYLEALRVSPGYSYAEDRIRSITDPSYDASYWRGESSPFSASVWTDISLDYGNTDHKTYSGGANWSWNYGPRGSQVKTDFHGTLERLRARRLENSAYASVSVDYYLTGALYAKGSSAWDRQPDTVRPWQISSYSSIGYKEWIRDWLWISPEVGAGIVNSQWYLREKRTSDWTAYFSLGIWMEKAGSMLPTLWISTSCFVPPDKPEDLIASGNAEVSADLWDRLSLSVGCYLDFTNRPVIPTWDRLDSEIYSRLSFSIF